MKNLHLSVFLLSAFVFVMLLPLPARADSVFEVSCVYTHEVARECHWAVALSLMLLVSFYFWRAGSVRKEKGLLVLSSLLLVLMATFPLVVFDDVDVCEDVFAHDAVVNVVLISNLTVIIGLFSVFAVTWWSVFFLSGVRLFRLYARRSAFRKQVAVRFVLLCLGCVGALYTFFVFSYLMNIFINGVGF